MTCGIVRGEVQTLPDLSLGPAPVPIIEKSYESERDVGAGVSFINLHGPERCSTGFRKRISWCEHGEVAQHAINVGEGGVRRRIGRVRVDSLPREINSFPKPVRG